MKELLVGVDPHRRTNTAQMMDGSGQELGAAFKFLNNRPGAEAFVKQLSQQVEAGEYEAIRIATEATGWYWFHFFQQLSQDPLLKQQPLQLYALNPRLTAKYKQTYGDLDKDDPIDAFVVADRLRMGRDLPPSFQGADAYLALRFVTRYRYRVVHQLAKEKAYCLAILYLKYSEYSLKHRRPFADIFGVTSRAVIEEFASIEEIAALPLDELIEFIDRKGKRRFTNPTHNARKLQQVAQDSYLLPLILQQPVNDVLHLSLQHITFLQRQLKRLDTAIAKQLRPIPNTLQTIPGIGPVFCAGIIAEIGDLQRFEADEAKVAKYAGFKWRQSKSGDTRSEYTPITFKRNPFLRYYFCEAANVVRMHDPHYALYYDRKYHEVPKHRHKRAIVLTARKLVRLVVRLLTSNQPFQPRRP
jgi:transposase